MSCQVLGGSADGHLALIDHETDVGPLGKGVQVDPPLDERLREILPARFELVSPEIRKIGKLTGLSWAAASHWTPETASAPAARTA